MSADQWCHSLSQREVFFGGVLGIAGFVGAVRADSFHRSLALEASMAWIAVIAGVVVVVLAALLLARFAKRSSTVTQSYVIDLPGR